jgi:hypothetical protein
MKKKTWKTIALTSASIAVASIVVAFEFLRELEELQDTNTELLKQMADDGEIQNLNIGGVPYEVEV